MYQLVTDLAQEHFAPLQFVPTALAFHPFEPALPGSALLQSGDEHIQWCVDSDHEIGPIGPIGVGACEHPCFIGPQRRGPPLLDGTLIHDVDATAAVPTAQRVPYDQQVHRTRDPVPMVVLAPHADIKHNPAGAGLPRST